MAHVRDEYGHLAALLAEHAGLAADDPGRARLREQLTVEFLPVARHIAKRFSGRGESLEDLEQVATIGLVGALDRFAPDRGRDFLAFAVPTMIGEVRRHFRDHCWAVHTPRGVKDRYVAVGVASAALSQDLARAPTVSEIAEHLQLSRDEVIEAVAVEDAMRPRSLDETLEGSGESALADVLGVSNADLDQVEVRVLVAGLLGQLPERERTIMVLRFVHEKTQSEIAEVLSISQMHVSRLLARTLGQLRDHVESRRAIPGPTTGRRSKPGRSGTAAGR